MSAVVASALRLVAVGAVTGAVAAIATGRVVTSLLYNVSPADWIALSGAAVATLTAALVASLIPAAQASRVDPNRRAARRVRRSPYFLGFGKRM
jgi:ABC-type antimicrobial peptide transport system permease subunit